MHRILLSLLLAMPLAAQNKSIQDKPQLTPPPIPEIEPYPPVAQVEAAMKKAVMYARTSLSFSGGYATRWSRDLLESRTSDTEGSALISIESPGTPVMGLTFLRCWKVTGDPLYLQAAREAAGALLWTQLASGGWSTYHNYELAAARKQHYRRDLEAGDTERGKRHARTTLDDNKTQLALLFLMELAHLPESKSDAPLQAAVKFGLDALLAAQSPNGGWPQGFSGPADPTAPVQKPVLPATWPRTWPALEYTGYYTINDGNLRSVSRLLGRASELDGDKRCLAALRKLGDFLLLAQCPEPQAGWAQQYNRAMEPAWARKFEPPCVSTGETLSALETLNEIWRVTGDDKYRAPFASALAWLEKSRLPDGQYARFMELHTNQPLYFVKDTYELTHDDSNLPTHYGFKLNDLQEDIDKFKAASSLSRDEQNAKRARPATPKKWLSNAKGAASKVVTGLRDQNQEGVWTKDNLIEAALFLKHLEAFTNYLEAAKEAGELFEALQATENPKREGKLPAAP